MKEKYESPRMHAVKISEENSAVVHELVMGKQLAGCFSVMQNLEDRDVRCLVECMTVISESYEDVEDDTKREYAMSAAVVIAAIILRQLERDAKEYAEELRS